MAKYFKIPKATKATREAIFEYLSSAPADLHAFMNKVACLTMDYHIAEDSPELGGPKNVRALIKDAEELDSLILKEFRNYRNKCGKKFTGSDFSHVMLDVWLAYMRSRAILFVEGPDEQAEEDALADVEVQEIEEVVTKPKKRKPRKTKTKEEKGPSQAIRDKIKDKVKAKPKKRRTKKAKAEAEAEATKEKPDVKTKPKAKRKTKRKTAAAAA